MSDTTSSNNQPEADASLDAHGVAALLLGRDQDDSAPAQPEPGAPSSVGSPKPSAPHEAGRAQESGFEAISIPVLQQDGAQPGDEEEEEELADGKEGTEWPESAKKRIGKLTAQKHGLVSEKEQLAARVQELERKLTEEPQASPAEADVPLADVPTFEALEDKRQSAIRALDWLIANPYGGEVPDGKGGSVTLSAQDIEERKTYVQRVLQVQIPQRERWLAEHNNHNRQLEAVYPDLYKPGPQSDAAYALLEEMPELSRRPDYVAVVGDILVGRAVRSGQYVLVPRGESRRKADTAPAPPSVPPKTTPATVPAGRAAEVRQQFMRTGEPTDLAAAIEARL